MNSYFSNHVLCPFLCFYSCLKKKKRFQTNRYDHAHETQPEWRARSAHLSNNVAICAVRRAYALATSKPPPHHHQQHQQQNVGHLRLHGAEEEHVVAEQRFEHALQVLRLKPAAGKVVPTAEEGDEGDEEEGGDLGAGGHADHIEAVRSNYQKFKQWQAQGGDFQGSLMW